MTEIRSFDFSQDTVSLVEHAVKHIPHRGLLMVKTA
jgi:hypothetical protein